jgi:hypothetical protein
MKRQLGVVSAVVLIAVSGAGAQAQQAGQVQPTADVNVRADKFKQSAEALYGEPRRLRRAAELHEQEAALRSAADPLQVEALDRAARLYTYVGEPDKGHVLMEKAARLALRRGDVVRAAHAFIDAAFMALRIQDVKLANTLTKEADLLAMSPLLPPADKLATVKRIDPARAQLGALH